MRTSLVLLILLPTAALAQADPRAVIEQAIAAHGGREKLAQVRADKAQLKGTLHVGGEALPFTNSLTLQLPGQFKSVVSFESAGRTHTVVHLLDGDRATILLDGKPQAVDAAHLAQLRQTLQLEQALRLVPLLTDPGFTLQPLPEVRYKLHPTPEGRYNDQVYAGVRVQAKGRSDLRLYFDRASGLLVKAEHTLEGPGGKAVVQEAFYGGYRDVGGYRRPGKIIVLRDGKKVMEAELIDARRFDRIDPIEFSRP